MKFTSRKMNRTTIFNQTARKCDLTESALCDDIHDNMRALAFMYPQSEELKAVFERVSSFELAIFSHFQSDSVFPQGMFSKSNPKAFPHVMKYLFTICDPNEFKKKFCWPIFNKAAEATFR